mmetsp:Transcript_14756/g.28051  ORF Transcript_14756/g.28051 Transcript_14756/m.28051 type:complete len:435 (+) Transcript_14756:81-1385(+)
MNRSTKTDSQSSTSMARRCVPGSKQGTKPSSSSLKSRRSTQTAKHFTRHFVQHDYHDHAAEVDTTGYIPIKRKRGGVLQPFPVKLYDVLERLEQEGHDDVIGWQPHGRCFVIRQPKVFVQEFMQKHFSQTKLTSFQRQLNLYGFVRLTQGPDANGYYHELFLKGKRFLCNRIARTRIKGTRIKGASNPEDEPNFYAMPPVHKIIAQDSKADQASLTVESTEEAKPTQEGPSQVEEKQLSLPNLNLGLMMDHIDWSSSVPTSTPTTDEAIVEECTKPSDIDTTMASDSVMNAPEKQSQANYLRNNMSSTASNPSTILSGSIVTIDYPPPSCPFGSGTSAPCAASPSSEPVFLPPTHHTSHDPNQNLGNLYDSWWEATGVHLLDDFVQDWLPQRANTAVISSEEHMRWNDDSLGSMIDLLLMNDDDSTDPPVVHEM